jgi:hypothetical protein
MKKLIAITLSIAIASVIAFSNYQKEPVIVRDNYVHEDGWVGNLPKPKPSWSLTGIATWFDATKNNAWYTRKNKWGKAIKFYVAAGPELRKLIPNKWRMKPVAIRITSVKTGRSVIAYVVDWCGCSGRASDPNDTRLVDLAPAIWDALGIRLGLGVTKVVVEIP